MKCPSTFRTRYKQFECFITVIQFTVAFWQYFVSISQELHTRVGFVTDNADDISTNNDNISDNEKSIATLIAEAIINAEDISSNAEDISSNTDDTEDNEDAIADNTADLEPLKLINITDIQVK